MVTQPLTAFMACSHDVEKCSKHGKNMDSYFYLLGLPFTDLPPCLDFFVAIYETRMEVYNYIAVHGLFVLLNNFMLFQNNICFVMSCKLPPNSLAKCTLACPSIVIGTWKTLNICKAIYIVM